MNREKYSVPAELVEDITELSAGSKLFEATGFSDVKVTVAGRVKKLRFAIKSTGVAEFQRKIQTKAPQPPQKTELFEADSPIGKAAGLTMKGPVSFPDLSDPEYVKKLDAWTNNFKWLIIIFALDVAVTNGDGQKLTKFEDIKKALQAAGMTGPQLDQIYFDVVNLTQWAEARADFLSGN